MRHVLHAGVVLLVAALGVALPACTESGSPGRASTPTQPTAASVHFERVPDDKLDPALRRFAEGGITDRRNAWWKQSEFKKAFDAAVAGENVEKWVRELNIVTVAPEAYYTPDGVAFLYSGVKPHEGGDKQLGIAFLPASKQLRIRIDEKCKETKYVGSSYSSLIGLLQWPGIPCDRNEKQE